MAGTLTANIAAFVPINMIAAPGGSTHFKIVSTGAEIDFENETFVMDAQATAVLPWDTTATAVINLVKTVTANSTILIQIVEVIVVPHNVYLAFSKKCS